MSVAGLRIWDADGTLMVDVTTRLTRIVNVISLPGNASGSIDLSAAGGKPWFRRGFQAMSTAGYGMWPVVNIVGTTINWDNTSSGSATNLLYGVY